MNRSFQFKAKIDNLFIISSSVQDDEIKANMSKFLCILTSGYIELSLKEILMKYASKTCSPNIQNYIENSMQNITNLKSRKIMETLDKFNSDWAIEYNSLITEELKDAIDTVVANRNNIAHGKDVGISYVRIKECYKKTLNVITIIEGIVK